VSVTEAKRMVTGGVGRRDQTLWATQFKRNKIMLNAVIKQRSPLSFAIRTYAFITRLSGFVTPARRAQTAHFIEQARNNTRRTTSIRANPVYGGKPQP
jgi:hypothetical protein